MIACHWASYYGHLPTVKYLLEHGTRVTERDNGGKTAFLNAAKNKNLDVVKLLLSSEGGAQA
jgi:ankyrin repeat protein